jgi:radical SAM superfamily enzyme YgiQ (UPF0313 family)
MNILLVYPETPSTFWSFRNAVKFISRKSGEPPLGLLTVAALLPADWQKKLIDMNVSPLSDEQLKWADYVFISGMNIHKESFKKVVKRCNELNTPVVAGGPMVTTDYQEFLGIDHFILNEAEITLPLFLNDLADGHPEHIYSTTEFPDIGHTPIPRWDLLEQKKYASMSIQYSRGCPYDCEFCSITVLNGRRPRVKSSGQFLAELEVLYALGWRGSVFVVDDNFIGNRIKLKKDLLPALIDWMEKYNHPFYFGTEASVNVADDEELMQLMSKAGFNHVFIGIETPNSESLAECGKKLNQRRDLLSAVQRLHKTGMRVSGGFIIGFDSDPANIFEQQINFIRRSGIVIAMVGLLNAPTGTRLFKRLKHENRLLNTFHGNNMDGAINFVPKMKYQNLIAGYKKVLESIYSQKEYYQRVKTFLKEYHSPFKGYSKLTICDIKALMKSLWILGVLESGKRYYWKLFFLGLFRYPRKFPLAITMAIYGFHFRKVVKTV